MNQVTQTLKALDDSYFIFSNFTLELFQVDHLVISDKGFFVIARIPFQGDIQITNGRLLAGSKNLDRMASRVWQVSHMINKIVMKGYEDCDVMPVPVLVATDSVTICVREFNGIAVLPICALKDFIVGTTTNAMDKSFAESFAFYIKKRYM
nr:nuclease-related domain-containing protein [Desulfobotulus pelophilus]